MNYTIGGTATNGTDYATITSPLIISAGNTTGTVTVNPTADSTIESNETVILTLSAGASYTVGAPSSATGNILNDDLPNLTINDVTANEGNAGIMNFTFTVSLSAPAGPGGVSFDIATANGTATAGVDYVANTLTSQTISAGSSSYTFTVQVNGDTPNEPSESFFVNVTNVTNAVVVDAQGVGTIVNDDALPSLSINDVTVTEGSSGTVNAVFTVTLSAASGQTVGVNYATADGTATQPTDYTSTSGSLSFTAGTTTQSITVPVIGDSIAETNENFFVNLSGATNATIGDNQGAGTITNAVQVPGAPVIGTATAGVAQASVTFTAPASNGGAAISGYTVTSSPGGLTGTGASSPITVTSLTNGVAYTFTVTATNSAGTGLASTASNSVTPAAATASLTGILTRASGVTATLDVSGCSAIGSAIFIDPPAGAPASFPFGLLDFTLTGCATGGSATVTVTYSQSLPAGAVFYKRQGGSYTTYPATLGVNSVSFTLIDGGAGDEDGVTNGSISDPGGIGVLGSGIASIPTLSQWGLIFLSLLLAGLAARRLRRR